MVPQLQKSSLMVACLAVVCLHALSKGAMAFPNGDSLEIGSRHFSRKLQFSPFEIQQDTQRISLKEVESEAGDSTSVGDVTATNKISQSPMVYILGVLGCMVLVSAAVGVLVAGSNQKSKTNTNWLCGASCIKSILCTRPSSEEVKVGFIKEKDDSNHYVQLFPLMPSGENSLIYELATANTDVAFEAINEKFADKSRKRTDSGIGDCVTVSDDESVTGRLTPTNKRAALTYTEMKGKFNQEGGLLESENSDVKLILPEGALQGDELRDIFVKIFVDVGLFPCPDKESFFITPIVECGPPGLQFRKPVQLVLPHRVKIGGPSKKIVSKIDSSLFQAIYSNDVIDFSKPALPCTREISFIPALHVTEATQGRSVTFDVDEKFVNINTTHFTLFGCIGPKRKHQLHLKTFAYYNTKIDNGKNRLIVQYRLYISSPESDRRMSIQETEQRLGGRLCTPLKPFNLLDKHDVYMETFLEDAESWTIRKPQEYIVHDEFYEDSSSCFQLTVTRPLTNDKEEVVSNCMMGEFRLVQRSNNKNRRNADHTYSQTLELTGVNLPIQRMVQKTASDSSIAKDAAITDKTLSFVSAQLPPKELRKLGRSLGLGDVTIDQIEHDYSHDGAEEQTYQILRKWKIGKGSDATFECLLKALEDCECCNVAEMLYTESPW